MSFDTETPPPTPPPSNTRPAWVMPAVIGTVVIGALFALIIVLAIVMTATGALDTEPEPTPTPTAAPAPTVTETEAAPEPVDDPRDDSQYGLVQGLLDKARDSAGGSTAAICVSYDLDPVKWEMKFARIAVNELDVDQDIAEVAVEDYFAELCGT